VSASIHVATPGGDQTIARLLEQHFCAEIAEPMEREIGIARHAQDTWIVLGAPLATPQPQDAPAVSRRVLELVNEARARPTRCGRQMFNATTQLKLSTALGNAALAHSLDMAARGISNTRARTAAPLPPVSLARLRLARRGGKPGRGRADGGRGRGGMAAKHGALPEPHGPALYGHGSGFIVNPKNPSLILWTQVFAQAEPGSPTHTTGS